MMHKNIDRTALSGRAAAGSRTAVRNLWRGLLPVLLCLSLFLGFAAEAQAQASCSASDTAVTAVASGAPATTLATECATLLDLLPTLRGGTGEALNWANSLSMADWEGITLSGSRVTKVEVSRKMFNGTISSSIATLTELTNLLLEANDITGPIPDLSALTKLEWLQLNDNELTGTINVDHIPASLVSLALSSNNLSGPFPDLSKFTSLKLINLHQNNLTGSVSTLSSPSLANVTNLAINDNRLSGEVPDLSNMTGLDTLFISGNDFTGDFPSLASAAPLRRVYAHRNRLSGSIPDFSSYESLRDLALSDNEFSGTINASHLPEETLRDLYLHRNKLTGSLPSMNAFTKLRYFYVHGNQLSGALPTTWDALTSLQQLHLSHNSFTGAIPSGLDDLDALADLSLCSTNLDSSATLPTVLEARRMAGNLTLFKCIWVDDAEAAEGSAIQFTVDYNIFPLKGSSGEAALQLSYETEDITATDGSDYTGTSSGSVTIPAITSTTASSSSATFSVQTTADSVAEPDETFIVRLGDLPNGLAGRSSAVGKIQGTAAECAAQNTVFSETSLRILETGETTYCVRLTTAPAGGDTTVTIGRIGGGATASPTSLTFTSSNYQTPQQVTVTGMDEPGSHRNRTTRLSHTAAGGGLSQNLGDVLVAVDDAPEVEAWWHIKGSARIRRPHTVTSTPGLTPWQNAAPGYELAYVVRLSNRPEPDGTVTVTATVPSDKRNYVGLSLTGPSVPLDGPAYHNWATNLPGTVDVEFKDRSPGAGTGCSNWLGLEDHEYLDSRGYKRTVSGGGKSESYDGTADTPWECWRMIYVVRKPASRNIDDTCADITHTATGGGVRKVTVDTVRAHVRNPSRNRRGSRGYNSQCRNLTGNTLPPQGSPAQAAAAPTEAVANVQVAAVDDARASVTWDAVEHATSYYVSWSAESGDSLNASTGAESVTGTTATVRHDASVPMTLMVTITPEYIDENGDTQQLDSLAGTATLAVGPTDGLIGSGGGTNGGGDGDAVQAGEGESPGAASFALPVAHWRFDGDALDWAGSSHGTVGGGAAFAANDEGEGVGSHALVLDGSDDYMDLASHVSNFPLGDAARSVTGWFKADAGNQRQTFFTYGLNVAGQRFSIAADRTQALVAVSGHAWGVNGLDLAEGWHHVAVTYAGGDSDSISIYLDGALQAASTLVGAPQALDTQPGSPGSSPAAIGRNADGGAHYEGSIDDVRIYAAALNAEQVLALFDEHPQTPPPTTTAVTATATPALAEGNLDGADVELTLDAGAFAATVATSDITASGVSGVGVSSVTRDSDSQATATLAFDGTDFDADATLTLTVSADVLAHSDTDLSATLPVTAVDEPPPPPPAVSVPAPVAHWSFDGDADDSAGSSNGSAMNGASFTTAASVGSHALSLDGSDDHVDLASHVSSFPLGNSARSVTGWFRAEAGNQRQTFFTYGPNVEGKRLSIAADRTQALVAVSGHAWGVNNLSLADGWHHVAVTFAGGDSDDFSIYLNGALQSASTLGGVRRQVNTRTGTAAIGQNVGGNAHYSGDIDDVRLYDYALSAEQVQAIAGRQETASAQDGAQATAAMPGGLLPAPLALPRVSVGADGTGAGGFNTDDASLVNGTGSSFALESGDTPESDNPRNQSILPSDSRAPSLATTASATTATGRTHAPLVPGSSNPLREGLVRVVNPSAQAGEVQIVAIDDAGWRSAPVTLAIAAGASAQFTSRDLEQGNAALGLLGSTGPGTGDWRLEMSSDLDVEVLPYVRTTDGTLSAMGDVAPVTDNVHRVALFNPADSPDAASKLRLTNRGSQALRADITGIDDTGASPGGMVSVEIASDESVLLTAAELETGGSNLLGALGDGEGQWRLDIASDGDLAVMNLAETSDGNLTNLSNATATTVPARKAHVVDRFPSSSDLSNEQGVVRIVNSSESPAVVRIEPNDSTGWRYAPLTLTLGANEAANLGTWDLELGNAAKGLSGNAGPGTGGAWRLAISSDSDIEVLTYTRTSSGLLKVPPADTVTEDKLR